MQEEMNFCTKMHLIFLGFELKIGRGIFLDVGVHALGVGLLFLIEVYCYKYFIPCIGG